MFLEKKWKVIGHYNKSKKKMVYLQKKYGTQIKLFQLDLSNPKKILTFAKQKLEQGKADLLAKSKSMLNE